MAVLAHFSSKNSLKPSHLHTTAFCAHILATIYSKNKQFDDIFEYNYMTHVTYHLMVGGRKAREAERSEVRPTSKDCG